MRLVDAEELSKRLSDLETLATNRFVDTPYNSPSRERYRAQMDARRETLRMIAGAHTITPESLVRRGSWEKVEDLGGDSHWMCSSCGIEWYFEADGPVENGCNYCPGCGAKMDLEE